MRKLISFIIFSSLLLTGCSLNSINAKPKEDKVAISQTEEPTILPAGTFVAEPVVFDATTVPISTKDINVEVSEIQYHIWRTADGQDSLEVFSSVDSSTDFSYLFDLEAFSGQRGEYQVEVYGITEDDQQVLLAESTVVFPQNVPILMYHATAEYEGNGLQELFVTPSNFKEQMTYLKDNGYTFLTFERWEDVNKVNKPVFVTFDDGMKNNLNAFHILQELQDDNFKPTATAYVIAGSIDKNPNRLSSNDLKEMVDSGIFSIQSHTMSHADLPEITNYEEELKEAKEKIEAVTNQPVIAIAYPFGHYDDEVVAETGKYYQFATTTKPGQFVEKGEPNELLLMQRVRISYSTTIEQFASLVK